MDHPSDNIVYPTKRPKTVQNISEKVTPPKVHSYVQTASFASEIHVTSNMQKIANNAPTSPRKRGPSFLATGLPGADAPHHGATAMNNPMSVTPTSRRRASMMPPVPAASVSPPGGADDLRRISNILGAAQDEERRQFRRNM